VYLQIRKSFRLLAMNKIISTSVDYFSRLCVLLLNDGTDAVRWFFVDHLPLDDNGTLLSFKQVF